MQIRACFQPVQAISLALTCLLAMPATAQVLYRYLDKNGRIVVSDKPPAEGKFERIEPDVNVNVIQSPRSSGPTRETDNGKRISAREALRTQLLAELEAARRQLDDARRILEEGREPQENEMRPIQTPPDNGGKPNSKGQVTAKGGRLICPFDSYGKPVCVSGNAPNEEYFQRIERLEERVKSAEQALKEAERRYRRDWPD